MAKTAVSLDEAKTSAAVVAPERPATPARQEEAANTVRTWRWRVSEDDLPVPEKRPTGFAKAYRWLYEYNKY